MRFQSLVLLLGVASVSAQDVCDECIETAAEMQALWYTHASLFDEDQVKKLTYPLCNQVQRNERGRNPRIS